jgi:preprotein translocase subunit YajC
MNLLIVIVVIAVIVLFFMLPTRRRQRSHAEMQDAIVAGDEIITAGGIHAIVQEADGSELRIEIAPGVVVTLDRRAVAAVAQEVHPADEELVDANSPEVPDLVDENDPTAS